MNVLSLNLQGGWAESHLRCSWKKCVKWCLNLTVINLRYCILGKSLTSKKQQASMLISVVQGMIDIKRFIFMMSCLPDGGMMKFLEA